MEGFQSNQDAVGAKVVITGNFGTQIREVRAGESYGITCTFSCHFGLGTDESVETATVKWPSGLETIIDNPAINQYHTINEAPCLVDVAIESSAYGFCPGESVVITAPDGFETYQWSNGVTGVNSITVSNGGNFSILVTNLEGCAGSSNVLSVVEVIGDQPTIEISGSLNLCDGGAIEMSASNAESWLWSTGEETQSISVTSEGTYSVSVVDICSNASASEAYNVSLFDSPVGPPTLTASASELDSPASVTLEATGGENIMWFDAEVEGNVLHEGEVYETNVLEASTTFWASASYITSGEIAVGGELTNQLTGQYHSNSNRWLEFDAYENLLLSRVTVFANGSYDRTFELIDESNTVLASTTVFVEDGEFEVTLNFEVPAGNGYGLRSSSDDPQLWREGTDSELSYPYSLGDLASITNSTAGPEFSYYYFFYNWQVEPLPIACESDRVSLTISVSGIEELISADNFLPLVSPNPVLSTGSVSISNFPSFPCEVVMTDTQGRMIYTGDSKEINLMNVEAGTYVLSVIRKSNHLILGTSRLIVQ